MMVACWLSNDSLICQPWSAAIVFELGAAVEIICFRQEPEGTYIYYIATVDVHIEEPPLIMLVKLLFCALGKKQTLRVPILVIWDSWVLRFIIFGT